MPCETVVDEGSVTVIACTRGTKRCKCGQRATGSCDFQLKGRLAGKTCDAPLCERCAHHVGKGRAYCPPHARLARRGDG